MTATLAIDVPNYKRWQPKPVKDRVWIAIDAHFYSNPRVRSLKKSCTDGFYCFMWILAHINDYEHNRLVIWESHLKEGLKHAVNSQSNRFDAMKRLKLLASHGLITYQILSESQVTSAEPMGKHQPNSVQTTVKDPLDTDQPRQPSVPKQTEQLKKTHAMIPAVCWEVLSQRWQQLSGKALPMDWQLRLKVDVQTRADAQQMAEAMTIAFERKRRQKQAVHYNYVRAIYQGLQVSTSVRRTAFAHVCGPLPKNFFEILKPWFLPSSVVTALHGGTLNASDLSIVTMHPIDRC